MQTTSSGKVTCLDEPCQNGGTCVDREEGGVNCTCTEEFFGDYCTKSNSEYKGNALFYTVSTSNS